MTREEAVRTLNVNPETSSEEIEQKATELAGELEIKIAEAQTPEFAVKLRKRRADVLLARDVLLQRLPTESAPNLPAPEPPPAPNAADSRVLVKVTERSKIMLNGALVAEAVPEAPLVLAIVRPGDQLIRAIPIASENEPVDKVVAVGHGLQAVASFDWTEVKPRLLHWLTGGLVMAVVISGAFALGGTTATEAPIPDLILRQPADGGRHVYMTQDDNLRLVFGTSDGKHVMGDSFIAPSTVSIKAELIDPDGEGVQRMEVWRGKAGKKDPPEGTPAQVTMTTGSNVITATLVPPERGEWYYYVKGVQADGNAAYSAPMWIVWPHLDEGAEHGATGWTGNHANSETNWQIEPSTASASGSYRFRTPVDASSTYVNNGDWNLVSPEFSLAGKKTATLTYSTYYQTESGNDKFRTLVTTNGGSSWTTLREASGVSGDRWQPVSLSLDKFVGNPAVKVRFQFKTDHSVVGWGVALDDILVTAR